MKIMQQIEVPIKKRAKLVQNNKYSLRMTLPKEIVNEFNLSDEYRPKIIKVYGEQPYLKILLPPDIMIEQKYVEMVKLLKQEKYLSKKEFWNHFSNKKLSFKIWEKMKQSTVLSVKDEGIYYTK